MKKILILVAISSSVLFAESEATVNQKAIMQDMEVSLAVIQKGFLYNDGALVKGGVASLQKSVKHIEPPSKADEEILGKGNTYSYKYAKRQSARISMLSQDILDSYEKGENYSAMNKYKETLKQCLACHKKIRRW
ncbi:hypothetical protein MNB_SV-6-354 [hydrothermal vent metagenome]|uniref:Cytochrome C n=1 Tax=hydrothermal vent metagenome TaxID=652676 RepID=A0A1W1C8J9_9ZZZZ